MEFQSRAGLPLVVSAPPLGWEGDVRWEVPKCFASLEGVVFRRPFAIKGPVKTGDVLVAALREELPVLGSEGNATHGAYEEDSM